MGFPGKKFFSRLVMIVGVFVMSSTVQANLTDNVVGSYAGNLHYDETSCSTSPDSSETAAVEFTVTKLGTNSFAATGVVTFSNGETSGFSFTSFYGLTPSTYNLTWDSTGTNHSTLANGSASGSVGTNTLTISGGGSETNGEWCSISFSGTISKATGVIVTSTAASSSVTNLIGGTIFVQTVAIAITNHLSGAAFRPGGFIGPTTVSDNKFKMGGATGLNAGDNSTLAYGLWGNYSYTDYDNDLSSIAYDGRSHGLLGGIDFSLWKNTILGVAVGYDDSDIDTTFNGGEQSSNTFTIAPYFAAVLNDTFSIDFSAGYSNVDYDQYRIVPGTTTTASSDPGGYKWFGAMNLNAVTYYENWIIGGRIGGLWAKSTVEDFTETYSDGTLPTAVGEDEISVGTASIAVDIAYSMQNNYEPFLNVSYQNDFSFQKATVATGPQPSNDTDDILMTLGVRYFNKNGVSGNIEYGTRFGREDFSEDKFSATVRVDF